MWGGFVFLVEGVALREVVVVWGWGVKTPGLGVFAPSPPKLFGGVLIKS
jgi:hypothetical protein